jgi:hypothetical protein
MQPLHIIAHICLAIQLASAAKSADKDDKAFCWDAIASLNMDALGVIISALGWIISLVVLYYIQNELKMAIKNRNLSFSSDVDKMLIEHPELWEFYDSHIGKFSGANKEEFLVCKEYITKEFVSIEDCKGVTIESDRKIKICFYGRDKKIYDRKVRKHTFKNKGWCKIETDGKTTIRRLEPFKITTLSARNKLLEGKLNAFTYFMLNHFEVILLEKNHETYPAWRRYMQYCLRRSERFREKVDKIIIEDIDFKGLYRDDFTRELKKMKKEYEDNTDIS